jgi:hypothetical protein
MQKTQVLIIGHGLCGAWLSQMLAAKNISNIVIDSGAKNTASSIASGIINPVSGFTFAVSELAEKTIPMAVAAYQKTLPSCIKPIPHYHFLQNQTEQHFFDKKLQENSPFLEACTQEIPFFEHDLGIALLKNNWLVHVEAFLTNNIKKLGKNYKEEFYENEFLVVNNNSITYRNITAQKIIFCEGAAAFSNSYFKQLPFVLAKGEALIADIPNLPSNAIYKNKFSIVPWKNGLWWIGSNFERNFIDNLPTGAFKQEVTDWLTSFLKIPFSIIEHVAAIRPTTANRLPIAYIDQNVGILNGMGTKACSLAPYFAEQLAKEIEQRL